MTQNAHRPRLADLALVTYLAPMLQGRRVAVAGSTSGEVALRLRALGAHTVICFGGVGEDLAVRALTPGAVAAFHGRIDVLVIPDATAVPSLVALLDEARRALGSEGVVVVGAEAPQSPRPMEPTGREGTTAYHDLYDLCAARFSNVRMFGRGPFLGYTLAAFDDASDRVALDTRLIDGDPARPESFIAIASDAPVELDPVALVQVPDTLIEALRDAGGKELREKLHDREQKLKEVEAASAERWVKIQRFEHGLKELEEENRKAREKVVRATKELEDERKLRQRVELDAQMSRRAPELPKTPDLAPELQRARKELAELREAAAREQAARDAELAKLKSALERETAERAAAQLALASRAETAAGLEASLRAAAEERDALREAERAEREALQAERARVAELERELDETQATEAELQALLEAAQSAQPAAPPVDDRALRALRDELDATRASLAALRAAHDAQGLDLDRLHAERDAVKSELAAALATQQTLKADLAQALSRPALDDSAHEVAALEARLADRATELLRMTALRDDALTAVRELTMSTRAPVSVTRDDARDALEPELRGLRERVSLLEAEAIAFAGQSQQAMWKVEELEAALALARSQLAARTAPPEAGATAAELSSLRAENGALEAKLAQAGMEIDGFRAGYQRRILELELEIDRLLRALEVAGSQTAAESDAQLASVRRQAAEAAAELQGVRYRMCEAESALSARSAPAVAPVAVEVRADQALTDLGQTAERLAATEEALREVRLRLRATEAELAASRREQTVLAERVDEAAAQLDERDRRDAAAAQRHREQLVALQDRVTSAELRVQSQRELLGGVRSSVSSILADGRGALVVHDLLQILRTVESSDEG
ncbi:MAG: hypothetical protein R3A48_02975 [Polyangiales bacterium]